jgi:hypothetical protein
VGSNPTLSASLRQTARFARWLRAGRPASGASVLRRLSTGAASEASAWRRWTTPRPDSSLRRSAIAYRERCCFSFPANSPLPPLAQSLLRSGRGSPGKAIRLHHTKLESSAEALHRRDLRRRCAGERAQCRAEPFDGSVETVGHRRDHRVPHRADGLALREVLEVRGRTRVREQPLRGRAMSGRIEPGAPYRDRRQGRAAAMCIG